MPPLTSDAIAVNLDNLSPPIDLPSLYRQKAPIHLEIGSGKGTFLLNQARAHPERNYFGIEWANKYYKYTVDRIRRWGCENVRVLRTDAVDFITRYLEDSSIAVLHVYFPDPWPKKRHHKRRFFSEANLLQVFRILAPGGQLRAATDHAEYFSVIAHLLREHPRIAPLFRETPFHPDETVPPGEWVGTNFERKYLKEGRDVYSIAMDKSASA